MSELAAPKPDAAPQQRREDLPVQESRRARLKREQMQGQDESGIKAPNANELVRDVIADQAEPAAKPRPEGEQPGDDDAPQAAAPRKLKELAKELGVDAKALYETRIPLGDAADKDISLGELKDFYRQNQAGIERLQRLDHEEVNFRSERAQAIQQLDQLVRYLPGDALNPNYLQAVQQQAQVIAKAETGKLLQAMPDLQDPATFQAVHGQMLETAQAYGLSESDVGNIIDHRWIMALRDLAQLKGLQKKAASAVPESKNLASKPNSMTPDKAAQAKERQTLTLAKKGNREAKQLAVRNLLMK